MKKRILITGASGFVGKRIMDELVLDPDAEVSILIRDTKKLQDAVNKNVRIYKGDITIPGTLTDALKEKDIVIHCAALMSNYESQPKEKFYAVNAVGTANLIKCCDPVTLKQFIHISTAGVYGSTGRYAAGEEAPYGRALSVYEWSKKEAELRLLDYAKAQCLPFTILRPSQLYGPGMRYGWPDTIKKIRSNSMMVPGAGKARIHFLNIKDLVSAVHLTVGNPMAMNRIYNLAGPETVTLADVFEVISDALKAGRPLSVPYLPAYLASLALAIVPYGVKSDAMRLLTPHRVKFFISDHVYDISKARRELGYDPIVGVKDGFCEMVQWCREEGLI